MSLINKQILFPAIVIDNNDPRMLGRVRAYRLDDDYVSVVKARSPVTKQEVSATDIPLIDQWTDKDPFVFFPLNSFFNQQIPLKNEYIHIVSIDSNQKYKLGNQYYILGPILAPQSSAKPIGQVGTVVSNFLKQGKIDNNIENLKSFTGYTGNYAGIYPEPGDNAILGRGSSDMILISSYLSEDHAVIRAGKYLNLDFNNEIKPRINNNRSFLQLSNFTVKKEKGETKTVVINEEITLKLYYLVQWNITNPENQMNKFNGVISLHQFYPNKFISTANFDYTTDYTNLVSAPIHSINFNLISRQGAINLINQYIKSVNSGLINIPPTSNIGTSEVFDFNAVSDPSKKIRFPFVVVPSENVKNYLNNPTSYPVQNTNLKVIVENVKFEGSNAIKCIILYNKDTTVKPTKLKLEEAQIFSSYTEQVSYSIMGGQNIFLLSQDQTIPGLQQVNFKDTLYRFPQDRLLDVREQTNSMVRGEKLVELIDLIVKFLIAHVHPIDGAPPVPQSADGTTIADIQSALANAPNTILNQNIRIN